MLFLHYYLQLQELETSGIGPSSTTLYLVLLNFIAYLLLHISKLYSAIYEGYVEHTHLNTKWFRECFTPLVLCAVTNEFVNNFFILFKFSYC